MAKGSGSRVAGSSGAKSGGRKRSRKAARAEEDEEGGGGAGFFLLDDEEPARGGDGSGGEDAEAQETAEQKRIRLARAYLEDLRAATAAVEGEQSDEDEAGAEGQQRRRAQLADDALADRLRLEALEAQGRLQRKLAHRLLLPEQPASGASSSSSAAAAARYGAGRFSRAHRLSPTALVLSSDERSAFSVSKDGTIVKWDLETMQRTQLARPGSKAAAAAVAAASTAADWVKRGPRQSPTSALLAAALSSDAKLLAVGGGDRSVHVFDADSGAHVASYPGHRDQVSSLAFRPGTHTLYSASYDRTVKIWSLDDAAYVDTLFGHQAEVLAIDAARAERVVSVGHDHTCRLWKIPEESHLVFRSPSMAQYAVTYISAGEWVSGGADGTLQVWNTLKKKPVSIVRGAHSSTPSGSSSDAAAAAGGAAAAAATAAELPPAGSWATANADTGSWVQALAVAPGTDLLASGAGDGHIRLWSVTPSKHGGAGGLQPVGALPAPGFVNGLALGRSGRLCVAALGQEPRLGRWGRAAGARNGLLVHRWDLADEGSGEDSDA